MNIEIERKFILRPKALLPPSERIINIRQGYLSCSTSTTIRVRTVDEKTAYLTIKGGGDINMVRRNEYEYEIPYEEALDLLKLCIGTPIVKSRHHIHVDGVLWEVDFFEGENEGLIMAEVELPSEETELSIPDWVSHEVTKDSKYYNSNLIRNPYKNWNNPI